VPPNQREYSWEDEQVSDLLQDLSNAMGRSRESYFLGTIVLTRARDDVLEVADGQQRLATVTMILAAMRNRWQGANDAVRARAIESNFLFKVDIRTKETVPRLTLNLDDNEYFLNLVLKNPRDQKSVVQPTRRSHRLINKALKRIDEHLDVMEKQYGKDFLGDRLVDWLEYLQGNATIVMFSVPSSANAFVMFETLNDRGLKTSQADLVKNFLFDKADDRREEAKQFWSAMRGAVESVTDEDLIMDFLRLSCCLLYGHTRVRDVMERIQANITSKTDALSIMRFFSELSIDYAAILNPDHPKWTGYGDSVKKSISTLNGVGVTQIRPLMLATAKCFNPAETAAAFRRFVSWSVRFLIIGERGGKLDEGYARLANRVYKGKLEGDASLVEEAKKGFVPTDAQFREQLYTARVRKSPLSRYYLRSLEMTAQNQKFPEFIPNDGLAVTLEHVMPKQPQDNWPNITNQDIETHCDRLGNLALLTADKNVRIGNESFAVKKTVYKTSTFVLTNQIAGMDDWGVEEIEKRQEVLARLAVRTWPL